MQSFVPGAGGTRFRIVQFPGASTRAFYQEAFRREYLVKAPGLAEAMERQDSEMHTTDSVDYGVVLSGEITLELDDGATVRLKQGDCVVQNGTRHAWRNSNTTPCVMAFVLVGAVRSFARSPCLAGRPHRVVLRTAGSLRRQATARWTWC